MNETMVAGLDSVGATALPNVAARPGAGGATRLDVAGSAEQVCQVSTGRKVAVDGCGQVPARVAPALVIGQGQTNCRSSWGASENSLPILGPT